MDRIGTFLRKQPRFLLFVEVVALAIARRADEERETSETSEELGETYDGHGALHLRATGEYTRARQLAPRSSREHLCAA